MRIILAVVTTLPYTVGIPDPEGALQTTLVALERFMTISIFPKLSVLVTLVLDRYRGPAAAVTAFSQVVSPSVTGNKDAAAVTVHPPATNIPDLEGKTCFGSLRHGQD